MPTLPALENPFAEKIPPLARTNEADPLPALLREAFAQGSALTPDGDRVPLHSSVAYEEAGWLYQLTRQLRPGHSLELGFGQGLCALAILQALQDNHGGIHHVLDPFQRRAQNVGLAMASRAGLANYLDFHEKSAEEVVPHLPPLQLALVDGSGLFDVALSEFVLVDRKLEVGGVIVWRDLWMPSRQKLVRYILSNRAYRLVPGDAMGGEPWTTRQRAQAVLAGVLGRLPWSNRLFRIELLEPWFAISRVNLIWLQKTGPDDRGGRFHKPF